MSPFTPPANLAAHPRRVPPGPSAPGPGRGGVHVRGPRTDARYVRYPVRMRAVRLLLT